jgi:two-component system, OmpR family, heavy metal sensor histidine kinase CusS
LGSDRFVVRDGLGRTVARPDPAAAAPAVEPRLVKAEFSPAEGQRVRTVTVQAWALGASPGGPPKPVTVFYSRSAAAFDSRMNRLAVWFAAFAGAAGLLTAGVALRVSRAALRPLSRTADQIASIDERQLDRRLDPAALPPELLPMAERLNEMLARLESAFAARRRFMADASHELRTPVAALVIGMEVSLRHPRDAQTYRRTLESCLNDARQLRQLVERLMEQVRSENLSHDEPAKEVDVAALLNQCADAVAPLLQARRLTLDRAIAAELRTSVAPGRLRSVVTNLLSNAAEYNRPGGTIELACSAVGSQLTICVKDTGPGIASEHLSLLFDPFYRADGARTHGSAEPGPDGSSGERQHLGLGLSLVRAHVQAMNGSVSVQSRVGEGSVFTVTLPVVTGGTATVSPATAPCPSAADDPPRRKIGSHGGLIETG